MTGDSHGPLDFVERGVENLINEAEVGNVSSFSSRASVAGEFSEEALQTGVDEWFEDIWIAVDEVALTMEKDETAARAGFRMKSQVMEKSPESRKRSTSAQWSS